MSGTEQPLILTESIIIGPHTTLTIIDAVILNLACHPFILTNETSAIVLHDCTIILADDYQWDTGSLYISGICHILGTHTWHQVIHDSLIIAQKSTLILGNGCTFYYDPREPKKRGIIFTDTSSTLMLDNAHLRSGQQGLMLTAGTVIVKGDCTAHAENNDRFYGISFGSGLNAADNIEFIVETVGSKLLITSPYFQEKRKKPLTKKMLTLLTHTVISIMACVGLMRIATYLLLDKPVTPSTSFTEASI